MSERSITGLTTRGEFLLDAQDGQIMLRGVNLGGDCKLPFPDGGTQFPTDFSDHRNVSFIGRPFPLEEADRHFNRLKHWGFNCLRLLITWEAVEHAGPGIYDFDYIDYLAEIVRRAGDHGMYVIVDFHQDAWSRMSGGSGAPGWTFEAVGLDFRKFPAAGAAIVMQSAFDYSNPNPHQESYPKMVWSSNYLAPANGIMWTLFWGGRLITPKFLVEGVNVQDFLQARLLGAMNEVARRLSSLSNVLGFDSLNEPSPGWLEAPLSARRYQFDDPGLLPLKPGPVWSPLDALAVAQGLTRSLPLLERDSATLRLRQAGERLMNPDGIRIWQDNVNCPFEAAGIYEMQQGSALGLREDAFTSTENRSLSITNDAYGPWFKDVARVMRQHRSDWILFAEQDPYAIFTGRKFPDSLPTNVVNASHWYDIGILYSKDFSRLDPVVMPQPCGKSTLSSRYLRELSLYKEASSKIEKGVPTLIGEFGIPFDLAEGRAYKKWAIGTRSDVWADHECALSMMFDAIDELGLHSMLWNYTATNRNDMRVGDGWNQEDLSIFSIDQIDDSENIDSGGRAISGFCRPYIRRTQGRLESFLFSEKTRSFLAHIEVHSATAGVTEIYVPDIHFPNGARIKLEGPGAVDARVVHDHQIIRIQHAYSGRCVILGAD